jgi:hypothetical protein
MSEIATRKTGPWPLLVGAIGVAFLAVTFWSIQQARERLSPVTDPEYYSHGLRYNQTSLEARAAVCGGWAMRSGLAGRRLTIVMENGQRQPVTGCRGELVIYDGSHQASRRLELAVTETTAGSYRIDLPVDLAGSLTGDLSLRRDGVRFNRRLLISL